MISHSVVVPIKCVAFLCFCVALCVILSVSSCLVVPWEYTEHSCVMFQLQHGGLDLTVQNNAGDCASLVTGECISEASQRQLSTPAQSWGGGQK